MFKRMTFWWVFFLFLATFVLVYFVAKDDIERIGVPSLLLGAAIPFLLSVMLSVYLSNETTNEFIKLKNEIELETTSLKIEINKNRILCHGSKHSVPNQEVFWINMIKNAKNRFILIGRSNKAWIAKSDEQSKIVSQAMLKIILGDGKVFIMSEDIEANKTRTVAFFRNYILNELFEMKPQDAIKYLKKIEKNLVYSVSHYKDVNYAGVVSDNRMFIIPTLNSQNFRDSGMVLEVIKELNPSEFDTYNCDIERVFLGKDNLFQPFLVDAKRKINK